MTSVLVIPIRNTQKRTKERRDKEKQEQWATVVQPPAQARVEPPEARRGKQGFSLTAFQRGAAP